MIDVRPAVPDDAAAWLRMRCAFWPDGSAAEHRAEIAAYLAGDAREPRAVLVAEDGDRVVGVVELSIRPCAEGCRTDRIAYLEGWYVQPSARRRGIGAALVAAAEVWGREQGCAEFASDTTVDNDGSAAAHRAVGFADVGLVRCFRKQL